MVDTHHPNMHIYLNLHQFFLDTFRMLPVLIRISLFFESSILTIYKVFIVTFRLI